LLLLPLSGHGREVTALAFSPDGRWLATGSYDSTARLWDLKADDPAENPRVLSERKGAVTALAISPDGRWLATNSYDGTARLWNLKAAEPGQTARVLSGHEGSVTALAISPDGRWLATASRWTCTDPDGEATTCILAPSPADADAPAVESAPDSEADLRGADQIFAEEPAPITLDAWLETSAPSPEGYHTIEQRRDFYATLCRLGQLGGADMEGWS
jgi:dipeptidyl aminopeptidase/acylaminoacyl peptidase